MEPLPVNRRPGKMPSSVIRRIALGLLCMVPVRAKNVGRLASMPLSFHTGTVSVRASGHCGSCLM